MRKEKIRANINFGGIEIEIGEQVSRLFKLLKKKLETQMKIGIKIKFLLKSLLIAL